jgi:hypothetical protein
MHFPWQAEQVPASEERLYLRAGQLDQLGEPHFRKQSGKSNVLLRSFCKCLLSVTLLSKSINTKMKIENLRQSGKKRL